MKTNETELLMKTWMCNTLGLLRILVAVWEQFHDGFLLNLLVKYYPEKGFGEETISWIWLDIFLLRNSLYLYGMFLRSFLRRKHILDIVNTLFDKKNSEVSVRKPL